MSIKFHRILNMISINCMSVSLVTCCNIQLICFDNQLSLVSFLLLPYCFWILRNEHLILGLVSRIFSTLIRNPNVLLPFLPPKQREMMFIRKKVGFVMELDYILCFGFQILILVIYLFNFSLIGSLFRTCHQNIVTQRLLKLQLKLGIFLKHDLIPFECPHLEARVCLLIDMRKYFPSSISLISKWGNWLQSIKIQDTSVVNKFQDNLGHFNNMCQTRHVDVLAICSDHCSNPKNYS